MNLPHPFNASPLPPAGDGNYSPAWRRHDERARVHNLARRVAMLPNKIARNDYLQEMAKKHPPHFLDRFRRLVRWYWQRQRQLQRAQA